MADNSYAELLKAKVELNLSDFREKLAAADAELDAFAAGPDVRREGSNFGFSEVGNAMIDAAVGQMEDFVTEVMLASQIEVPKDTGVLERSARPYVTPGGGRVPQREDQFMQPKLENKRVSVEFGYGFGDEVNERTGRVAAQYALQVHEIYEAAHAPPTKSHFLIDPLIDRASSYGYELKLAMQDRAIESNLRINRGIFLFRPGGGPGINPVVGPGGILKRRRT